MLRLSLTLFYSVFLPPVDGPSFLYDVLLHGKRSIESSHMFINDFICHFFCIEKENLYIEHGHFTKIEKILFRSYLGVKIPHDPTILYSHFIIADVGSDYLAPFYFISHYNFQHAF